MKNVFLPFMLLLLTVTGCKMSKEVKDNLTCYEFGIYELENNYPGFEYKVTNANRAEYEALKQELRDSIEAGKITGAVGVSELCAFMHDYHLGCPFRMWSDRYPMNWPTYKEEMTEYNPQPVAQKLDDQTFLLRFPTCMGDSVYVSWVWGAVDEYRQSGCPNLIVDVRGNGGGQDWQYYPIYRLLYAQPGVTHGVALLNTQEIRDSLRAAAAYANSDFWIAKMDSAEAHKDERWFPFEEHYFDKIVEEGVDPHRPQKTAIIIDRWVASSGEQFLIDTQAVAPDVRLYGRDNTLGCIDFSNERVVMLPDSVTTMNMPTTTSYRVIDGRLIDGIGIKPDVRIDLPLPEKLTDNVDEWVTWVAAKMKE